MPGIFYTDEWCCKTILVRKLRHWNSTLINIKLYVYLRILNSKKWLNSLWLNIHLCKLCYAYVICVGYLLPWLCLWHQVEGTYNYNLFFIWNEHKPHRFRQNSCDGLQLNLRSNTSNSPRMDVLTLVSFWRLVLTLFTFICYWRCTLSFLREIGIYLLACFENKAIFQ